MLNSPAESYMRELCRKQVSSSQDFFAHPCNQFEAWGKARMAALTQLLNRRQRLRLICGPDLRKSLVDFGLPISIGDLSSVLRIFTTRRPRQRSADKCGQSSSYAHFMDFTLICLIEIKPLMVEDGAR
jgi:hypothetical protein